MGHFKRILMELQDELQMNEAIESAKELRKLYGNAMADAFLEEFQSEKPIININKNEDDEQQ